MNYNIRVSIDGLDRPLQKTIGFRLDLDEREARAFLPLSPYHDASLYSQEWVIAQEQKRQRRELADYIARRLADAIVEIIQSQDPLRGYPPAVSKD